jgi:hypothetical protein
MKIILSFITIRPDMLVLAIGRKKRVAAKTREAGVKASEIQIIQHGRKRHAHAVTDEKIGWLNGLVSSNRASKRLRLQ